MSKGLDGFLAMNWSVEEILACLEILEASLFGFLRFKCYECSYRPLELVDVTVDVGDKLLVESSQAIKVCFEQNLSSLLQTLDDSPVVISERDSSDFYSLAINSDVEDGVLLADLVSEDIT